MMRPGRRALVRYALPGLLLACLGSACGAPTSSNAAAPGLPVAVLSCPEEARVGVPFDVDGSASSDGDGAFASVSLRLSPGDQEVADLRATFTAQSSGVATVILVVTDASAQVAEARCRIAVGGAGSDPTPGEPPAPGTPGTVDLSGAFALVAWDRPQLEGGALDPERQCAAAPHLSLVTMEQQGAQWSMTLEACVLTVPRVQVFALGRQDTEVPAALLEALPRVGPFSVTLSSSAVGATFAAGVVPPLVAGADLASDQEELPTDAGDPRVRDDDGDGAPGVTLVSNVGGLEVAYRRAVRALSGVVVSADEIDGSALGSFRVDTEASMLSFLGAFAPAGTGLPSTFRMLRADGAHGTQDYSGADGVLTCDDLRAHQEALLAQLPAEPVPAGCASF